MPLIGSLKLSKNVKCKLWTINKNEFSKDDYSELPEYDKILYNKRVKQIQKDQFIAVRKIINSEYPNEQIKYNNNKPELTNDEIISISHSDKIVIVGFSKKKIIGVDIQKIEKKLIKLKSKFVHEKEKYFVDGFKSPAELTLLWTIKEAIYKALGIKGVIFSKQLYSEKFCFGDQKGIAYYNNNTSDIEFKLYFYYLDNYCLTIAQKI